MVSSLAQTAGSGPILIVDLSRNFGGVDVRVIDVARGLHGLRPYAVAVLRDSLIHQRLAALNLNVLPIDVSRGDPRMLMALLREIRKGRYVVVDAHNPQSQFWGLMAAFIARVPGRISSVHTPYSVTPGGLKGWLYSQVLRLNGLWGCTYMTVSKSIASYLSSLGVKHSDIALIYNGVYVTAGPVRSGQSLRRELQLEDSDYVVAVVARLERQKGHDFLLKSLPTVIAQYPQVRVLIVGDGRLREALERQAEALGIRDYVAFTGFRKDVHDILAISDAFCLPSRAEGLPFALLEASMHQLPLLLSDVDGMGEWFTHKQTAYLFPPGDVYALADGLQWLIGHPDEASSMGLQAHEFVQMRLNPETMISETLALYDRVSVTAHDQRSSHFAAT